MDEGRWSPASKTQYNLIDAVSHCTTQLRPNIADAWSNLAGAYMRKGRLSEVGQCCRQALALNPRLVVDAHSNLGNHMKAQGLVEELKQNFTDAYLNMGNVYKALGMPQEAIMCYQRALLVRPDYAMAF
ncbi:putative udp-n-acetylglucosamine--peptide n-acetylglucosaminyltransferase sec, partial [Nicotiana attenuata]